MLNYYQKKNIKKGDTLSKFQNYSFINKSGKIIRPEELTFLGAGENSTVWKYQNYALKSFFAEYLNFALTYDCFNRMKDLPLKGTIKANDLFSEFTDCPKYKKLDAYLMDYQEPVEKSLLELPTDLFLNNLINIEEDGKILAENGIEMRDVKKENSLINASNELYLFDVDMYKIAYSLTVEQIISRNLIEINWFIKQYLHYELENLKLAKQISSEAYSLGNDQINKNFIGRLSTVKASSVLEDLFSKYETPKEYFLTRK